MSNVQVAIRATDVKNVSFTNDFKIKPGEKINIQVKHNAGIRLNPAQPNNAVVFVKFEAEDAEHGIKLVVETITALQANTFVDDFEKLIKDEYFSVVMLAANERIRIIASTLGLNLSTPPMVIGGNNSNE